MCGSILFSNYIIISRRIFTGFTFGQCFHHLDEVTVNICGSHVSVAANPCTSCPTTAAGGLANTRYHPSMLSTHVSNLRHTYINTHPPSPEREDTRGQSIFVRVDGDTEGRRVGGGHGSPSRPLTMPEKPAQSARFRGKSHMMQSIALNVLRHR